MGLGRSNSRGCVGGEVNAPAALTAAVRSFVKGTNLAVAVAPPASSPDHVLQVVEIRRVQLRGSGS